MQYRPMGRTGVSVSALGFGMLRLPMKGGHVDFEQTTPMVRRAIEGGVNYIDTGRVYLGGESEQAVGKALAGGAAVLRTLWIFKIQIETEENIMDGNHPKRRKDKYNPYTIGTTGDGRHWLTFSDGQGNRHHFEISAAVFALFDSFELDDLSYLNEVDRHYEQSELTEASLYDRAVHRPATVEESALQSMEYAQLHRAISELPEIQKRRLILYYFQGLTYEQIAGMEGCTFQAVAKSVAAAEKRLKNFFGIGG